MLKKRIGILTGGGDVPPLNAVLAAAQAAASERQLELLGFIRGWQGVLDNDFVILNRVVCSPRVGGTLLKSSRVNLTQVPDGFSRARRVLEQNGLAGLIVIGGEDTLSNAFGLPDFPRILISKTIDNDVGMLPGGRRVAPHEIVNYFTLGYPTAAKRISSYVSLGEGLRTTAYSHERIVIVESMGMHAGWLALASALGHPDFIIIPEFPLDYPALRTMVAERYVREKNLIVVVAEGARWGDGSYISADDSERDAFGHPRFVGAAETLAKRLKADLATHFDTRNVNFVNPSYLYRSGVPCRLDLLMAKKLGQKSVEMCLRGPSGLTLLTVQSEKDRFSVLPRAIDHLNSIKPLHRFVDRRFYDPFRLNVSRAGRNYLNPMVEDICGEKYGLK